MAIKPDFAIIFLLSSKDKLKFELLIETNIIPLVPEQGSVGASGDLAPLAHLFLPLIGLGYLYIYVFLFL